MTIMYTRALLQLSKQYIGECWLSHNMESENDYQSVEFPTELIQKVNQRLDYTEFDTPDEYLQYVVKEVLYQLESKEISVEANENKLESGETSEVKNEKEVERRLKSLGYLNE